jgi:hypothetical protein
MRSRLQNGLVAATLFFWLVFVAGTKAEQTANPVGRISGKVVDARSGAPLARCSVGIEPVTGQGQPQSLMTGEDGLFLFPGLMPGKYRLTAAKRGYLPQAYEQHGDYSTAIVVGPGLVSEGLIFKVVPEGIISGTVTDERGEPVRGAEVRLFEDQDREGIRSTAMRQMAITDDRGIYEIDNIAPGNYYVAVSAQPWYKQQIPGSLPPGDPRMQGEIDPQLDVVYPTTYYPQVTDWEEATPIPIKGGEHFQADTTLNAQQAMRLRLKLPAAQDPAHPGAYNVSLLENVFGQMQPFSSGSQRVQDGVLEIDGIMPGHYDVVLGHFQPDGGPAESTRFSADVAAGTTELNPPEVASEVTVLGRVTSRHGAVPAGDITFHVPQQSHIFSAKLNSSGEFSVRLPADQDYEVTGQIPQMYIVRIVSQSGELKDRTLRVKAGSAPKLEIVAASGFGQIDGVVQRGNQPASGVMVLLAPDDNQFLFRRDQSDSDGTFTLSDIVPGHYRLLAVDNGWDLEWANRSVLDAFLKKSVSIEVHANDKLTQDVEVQAR